MAIYCSNLFLYPSNAIDIASTVSGKSRGFRCKVMIWHALNGSGKIQVGHGENASTLDSYDPSKTDPYDHDHRPVVYSTNCLLILQWNKPISV